MSNETKTSNEKIKSAGLRGVQNRKAWKFIREANSDLRQLNHIAIEDGMNKYSYGVMFRNWDRYASVFSALGMTGENKARVGMMGSMSAEAIFVFYALNMVGAEISIVPSYSVFRPERIKQTIREEKLTDFILTDDFAQPNLIKDLHDRKKELGLRNVILVHVPIKGDTINPEITAIQEMKWLFLKSHFFPIAMENLLAAHENDPVNYALEESHDSAFILHTSGTTGGTGKPDVLSDKAFNAVPLSFSKLMKFEAITRDPVIGLGVDLSNAYGIIDQVHLPLAFGGTIAAAPAGVLNPNFHKAIPEFKMTVLFAVSALYERWLKMPENTRFDFSSLKCVVTGGTAVSAKDKKRYCEFLKTHGAEDFIFVNGYGISEVGGAACLSTADPEDESIGYLLPGFDFRLYDEDKGKYLSLKDAPCEGMLYLTSPSCPNPMMDGKQILEITMLNRKPFVCTNDIVRVEADGKINFLGRCSRYFINDSNRKFEAGRLETEIARQNGIESCCVVPVYIKTIHDNIPMLCVKTLPDDKPDLCIVNDVLRKVFVADKILSAENLPLRVMIVDEMPRNANGKIDLFRIGKGEISGDVYDLKALRIGERLIDIRLSPAEEKQPDMMKEVFDGIKADLKDNLQFHKNNMEEKTMNQNFNPFEHLDAMNRMGSQMWQGLQDQMYQNKAYMPNTQQFGPMLSRMLDQHVSMIIQMNQMGLQMFEKFHEQQLNMVKKMGEQNQQLIDKLNQIHNPSAPAAEAEAKQEEKTAEEQEKPAEE